MTSSKSYFVLLLHTNRCLEIGIQEVTVYAFSIENFKRSQDEVDTLMGLAKEKFAKVLEEKEKLNEKGVKIRVIGNLDMLPNDVQKVVAEAMLLTKDNNKSILNVAFAYTSRDEITHSIKSIVEGLEDNELLPEDVENILIDECLYTNQCSPVDLLVRTSGEMRFSDFLLWQVHHFKISSRRFYNCSIYHYFRYHQQSFISLIHYGLTSLYGICLQQCFTIKEALWKQKF